MDRVLEKKKFPPKKIAAYSAVGLFIVLVVYIFLSTVGESRLNVDMERITISTVYKGKFQEFIPIMGTVMPITTVYLESAEGGRVENIYMEAGNMVEKGEKILKLENTDLLLDIMHKEGQMFDFENNLRNTHLEMERNKLNLQSQLIEFDYQIKQAEIKYKRVIKLREKELISDEDFEKVKFDYEYYIKKREITIEKQKQDSLFRASQIKQLEQSLDRMHSNYEISKQKLENLTIRAPVSGQLTSLNAEVIGELKRPGERLGQIDVLSGFKVRAEIDEHYITRINLGLNGTFEFADKKYRLIVKKVYPEVVEGRFSVDMLFTDEQPEGIRQGQTLRIKLELGKLSEAILLPRGGFYDKTGGQWVYVVDESGDFATKKSIRIGRYNPEAFEILGALEPGDKVITSSYDNFGDIDKLILKD